MLLSKATYSAFRLYICIVSMCSLGIESTTFALLTQCSTTEPQEHLITVHARLWNMNGLNKMALVLYIKVNTGHRTLVNTFEIIFQFMISGVSFYLAQCTDSLWHHKIVFTTKPWHFAIHSHPGSLSEAGTPAAIVGHMTPGVWRCLEFPPIRQRTSAEPSLTTAKQTLVWPASLHWQVTKNTTNGAEKDQSFPPSALL